MNKYILQQADKSHCPVCNGKLDLLCRRDGHITSRNAPWFYICWPCMFIAQIGVGEVKREK